LALLPQQQQHEATKSPAVFVIEPLTERELEILHHVASGGRNREIARELHVSIKTVEFHLTNILGKLGVKSRTEAVVRALQLGWLGLRDDLRELRGGGTGGQRELVRVGLLDDRYVARRRPREGFR
jgi:DNA-binding CsgD family transcriptional regulator